MTDTPPAPPGWYPESGSLRWWDGSAWTEHRAPLASPLPAATFPGTPALALAPRRGPGVGLGCLVVLGVIFIPFFIWQAMGSPGGTPSAHETCIEDIDRAYPGPFENARIVSETETPIAWDVQGRFDGGTFACGFSKNPLTLEQAVVFLGDDAVVVIP